MITVTVLLSVLALLGIYEINCKEHKKLSAKEMTLVILLFAFAVFVFLCYTGVLFCGYQLIDDHELYYFKHEMNRTGFFPAMVDVIKGDLHKRYRVLYYVIRMIQCRIFGTNFTAWHIMYGFISVINLSLAYYYARKRGVHVFYAYLFAISILTWGGQKAIIWRLGPQENLGMIFLFGTVICLRNYYESSRKGYLISAFILTLLVCGIKESFVLILPGLPILLLIWQMQDDEGQKLCKAIISWFKKYFAYIIYTYLLFLASLIIIVFFIGTNEFEYVGIAQGSGLSEYFHGINSIIVNDIGLHSLLIAVLLLLMLASAIRARELKAFKWWQILTIILFAGMVFMQLILYTESGMYERYAVPTVVYIFGFVFIGLKDIYLTSKDRYNVFLVVILLFSILFTLNYDCESGARNFAYGGNLTGDIISTVRDRYSEGDRILVDMGGSGEYNISITTCLEEEYGIKMAYGAETLSDGVFYDNYLPEEGGASPISLEEADIVVRSDNLGENTSSIVEHADEYDTISMDSKTVYVRKR